MNVRERAKNYEAFVSRSSFIEKEKRQIGEEGIKKSGSIMDDRKRMVEGEKTKPVPPPRKKKPLDRPDGSPQPQCRSTLTMQIKRSPEVLEKAFQSQMPPPGESEKSKSSKCPPRPAPRYPTSSPSIQSKASLPRTGNKISPFESPPDTPKLSIKKSPKRPPLPCKTSSLPRKPKPPIPPKPCRSKKLVTEEQKEKSATLPITSLKYEKNTSEKQNVETKAERSLTGPERIALGKKQEIEENESKSYRIENSNKDISLGKKENAILFNDKLEENIKKEALGNTELEKVKSQELKSQYISESDSLSKNVEILNGVSQQEEQNRTLENEDLIDDKQPETVIKEENLNISQEKLKENKSKYFEEIIKENISGNDKNVTMDDDSERVVEVHGEDEAEEKENVPKKQPCFLSLNIGDNNLDNDHFSELSNKTLDLITKVEENISETPEESKSIMNSHCEDNSHENDDTTRLGQQKELFAGDTSVDIIGIPTKEKCRTNNEIDVGCAALVDDRILCGDDIVNSIKNPPKQASCEEDEVEQIPEDNRTLSREVVAVFEEHSEVQNITEVITEVLEKHCDVRDKKISHPSEIDNAIEESTKELKEPAEKEKHDLDGATPAVENFEGQIGEDVVDVVNDTTKENKQGWDMTMKYEDIGKEILDTQQQDLDETTIVEPSEVVVEYDLSSLQEEANVMPTEEILPGQFDSIEVDMEERMEKADHYGRLSNEEHIPKNPSSGDNTVRDKDTHFDIENKTLPEKNGDKIEEEQREYVSECQQTQYSKPEFEVDLKNNFAAAEQNTPRKPSRVKKVVKNSTNKDTENIEHTRSVVEPPKEESCEETELQSKSIQPYENVILDVASMEDAKAKASLTEKADHCGKLSNEEHIRENPSFSENSVRDKDTHFDIENKTLPGKSGDKIEEEQREYVSECQQTQYSKPEFEVDLKNNFAAVEQNTPRKPSRAKKVVKNSTNKDTENIEHTRSVVEPQKEESCEETGLQSKSIQPYENVILNVASMEDAKAKASLTEKADHYGKLSNEEHIRENPSFSENSVRDKDTHFDIENKTLPGKNGDKHEEEQREYVSECQQTQYSKPEFEVDLKNNFAAAEQNTPRKPSRAKKVVKNSTNKDTENIEHTRSVVEPQKEESCEETGLQSKSIQPYENVILNVASMEDAKAKASLSNSSQHIQQYGSEKLNSGYENVILRSEGIKQEECPESKSPGVYEVPRRRSFHSHTSEEKVIRISRSSSISSFRKSETEYKVPKPRSNTAAEEVYVVPRSTETESTYVLPKDNRPASLAIQAFSVSESEYHVPRSLIGEDSIEVECKVPPRTRATNGLEEGEYSIPRSPITVPRGSMVVQPSGSEEGEGVYSLPTSLPSIPSLTETETEIPPPEGGKDVVYSVPNTPLGIETGPCSNGTYVDESFKRSSRSSVLTSRNQLPASFSHVPPKPPRWSIRREAKSEDQNIRTKKENEVSKPIPIARNRIAASKESPSVELESVPRPKPRRFQECISTEISKDESPTPSPPKDQLQSPSSKPKRPAPPRPKAPSISSSPKEKKEKVTVKSEEKRYSAPPRPPPPHANRTSFAPSEPEPLSSVQGFPSESSESESEEDDKPTETTGPPKKQTYFIAHEILSTEKTFVNALSLCYEDCYSLIRNADVVSEATLNDIFKDLGNIYHLDSKFLQELEERMKTWEENERIGDIVKKYGHFLKMYTTYINNYDKAMNVLQETTKENPQFAELVQQFQASDKCKGLFLVSFMLKPVQRIPSYRLLLKDYLKHLPPDSEEFKDIQVALETVSKVATHINESMKKVDNFERVLRIQESMVGNAEIVKPGRALIKEGVLKKLCRKGMQERIFFLLTDVLLYTATVGNTQYKLKEKLPLLGMKVTLPESPDFENEFSIISKMRSFTLSASTSAERDEWIEELNNAINAMTDKKKTFLKSKVGTVVHTDLEEESKLGEKAPVWIPDARVTMCMLCTDNFTVTNRRHHCRGCGKVVCGSCSDNLAPLAYLDYVQARVCDVCYDFLLKEQNKNDISIDMERLPVSPLGMTSEDLDRIHRKPPKFEILHRFKPSSRGHGKRKSKAFGRPSVCTEVVGHESGSQMSGYLKFKRSNKHGWKRLWFVLKDNVLYSYKASEDVVAIETIPILGYNVQEATRTEDEIQFQLKHAGLPPITFKTESETSISRWIQELKKATTL